jgi:hypothetical protein
MRVSLQKYSRLARWFSMRCMLIHPVVTTKKPTLTDLKAAEEAVGLINALDYMVIPVFGETKIYDNDHNSSFF